jgi:hypothetical protein
MSFFTKEIFLLLGGAGMVGQQIAREIAGSDLDPHQIIICGITQKEVDAALQSLRSDFPEALFVGVAGDVFVRSEWNPTAGAKQLSRRQLMESEEHREALYTDLFNKNFAEVYPRSELVRLIEKFEPDVIIDSINTATAFSYQDVYAASDLVKKQFDKLKSETSADEDESHDSGFDKLVGAVGSALEKVLISQSIPQLVRHVRLINDAMRKVETRLYLKIGTTGTGGMGLNIPYTHSEESPSATLMEKTAVAFAHTGLLYLMARTYGGPAVKEFKPAAMIGYADIGYTPLIVKANGKIGTPGENFKLYASRSEPLSAEGSLRLRPPQADEIGYETIANLELAVVNTGENGLFTKGEFQTITYMGQMEFITPEEIAQQVVMEIKGSNTGYDVIAAIDGASMNPTYRAGYLRHLALRELEELEEEKQIPSVALGELGPPELGKLLWEAYLLHLVYKKEAKDENELKKVIDKSKDELAEEVSARLESDCQLRNAIVSVGLPILARDGQSLIRGPYLRIPETPNEDMIDYGPEQIDAWARKGWVDLRPDNMERWRQRFLEMKKATERVRKRGSAAFTREAYLSDEIKIGVVVGWIFNNEDSFGYRIK